MYFEWDPLIPDEFGGVGVGETLGLCVVALA